jgi:hypothetical protein
MKPLLPALALLTAINATSAMAASWTFSLVTSAGTFAGKLHGNSAGFLGPSTEVIDVTGISDITFNGTSALSPGYVGVSGYPLFPYSGQPYVTNDGSAMDFAVCDSAACNAWFAVGTSGSTLYPYYSRPVIISSSAFGSVSDIYSPSAWTLQPLASVPEPSSWSLLIVGFGLSGVALRRRAMGVARGV